MGNYLHFVDFELEHLNGFRPREEIKGLEQMMIFNLANPIFRTTSTLLDGDEVIGIVGYHIVAPGTLEVYLIPGEKFNKRARRAVEALRMMTDILLKRSYRVQMAVTSENKKWAEVLGFKLEAYLEKYHSGQDQFIYAKVSNGT